MTASYVKILKSNPGIDLDGTKFDASAYTDGDWVRFYRGLPRKIGGFTEVISHLSENPTIVRTLKAITGTNSTQATLRMYAGTSSGIYGTDFTLKGGVSAPVPCSPPPYQNPDGTYQPGGLYPDPNNLWDFQVMSVNSLLWSSNPPFPSGTANVTTYVIAFVAPNAQDPANSVSGYSAPNQTAVSGNLFIAPLSTAEAGKNYTPENLGAFSILWAGFPASVSIANIVNDSKASYNVIPPPPGIPTYNSQGPQSPSANVYHYGVTGVSPNTVVTPCNASGGICVCGPFLFVFGNGGTVSWSTPGNPFEFPGNQTSTLVSGDKVVAGRPTRGGGTPALLLWTLTSLTVATYAPTNVPIPNVSDASAGQSYSIALNTFSFDTIPSRISIISAQSIVEFNSCFYWLGVDQIYVYDGTCRTIPNTFCGRYFYENVNQDYIGRIWGMAIPEWNEIWWFWPSKDMTECDKVMIYTVNLECFHIINCPRSAGTFAYPYRYPFMANSGVNVREGTSSTNIFQHETGFDEVYLKTQTEATGKSYPIRSSFTTSIHNIPQESPDTNTTFLTRRIEQDFAWIPNTVSSSFKNEMTVEVLQSSYAAEAEVASDPITFNTAPQAGSKDLPYIDLRSQGGLVRYRFTSDVLGGSYQMGKLLLTYSAGSTRRG